jgi:hypothetical protein
MNFHRSNPKQTQVQKQSGKQVTWSDNLLDIRNISPRHSKDEFKFPTKPNTTTTKYLSNNTGQKTDCCNHFICGVGQPCRLKSRSSSSTLSKATNRHSFTSPALHPSNTTTHLNSSPELQEVVNRAVNANCDRLTPKNMKHFPYQVEKNSYNWRLNKNNPSLKFNGIEENINVRKI